jgi:hypothetical protein
MKESSARTWFAQQRQRTKKALGPVNIKEQPDPEEMNAAKKGDYSCANILPQKLNSS